MIPVRMYVIKIINLLWFENFAIFKTKKTIVNKPSSTHKVLMETDWVAITCDGINIVRNNILILFISVTV
jgi:hypothetical protein